MSALERVRRLIRVRPPTETVEQDVADEIAFHVRARIEDLERSGVAPHAARRALREFGDVTEARRELTALERRSLRRQSRQRWWFDLWLDACFAARSLRRRPGFTLAVLITLGLGIGAASAIFTVVKAAFVTALPYPNASQLVHLWETHGDGGGGISEASYPDYQDWRAQSTVFSALEGYDPTNVTVDGPVGPEMLRGARVSAGFFAMLRVAPRMGRAFAAGEDGPGGSEVAILSHGYWRRAFGDNPAAVGQSIIINHRPYRIIGVMPPGFQFAPAGSAELWLPLDRGTATRETRSNHWFSVVGRLRPGVTMERARQALSVVAQRLAAAYPESNAGRGVRVVPLRSEITGDLKPILVALTGAVGVLLLIGCANVASLLLARTLGRGRELAMRAAMGATRGRLMRQLLVESVLLATAGAGVGLALAWGGVHFLVAAVPDGVMDHLPYFRDAQPDGAVLAFTTALALLTGIAFGLAPALMASRPDPAALMTGGRTTPAGTRARLRDVLVAAELALTAVLLIGAGLIGRSLLRLLQQDAGFATEHVVTARVPLSGPAYETADAQQRFFEQLVAEVRSIPGVRDVGAVTSLPLNGGGTVTYRVDGSPEPPPGNHPEATFRGVAGDYFRVLSIPLVTGRVFDQTDDSTSPPVVVISQSLAEQHFPAGGAVGRRLRFYAFPQMAWQVIGVVGDVRTASLDAPSAPTVYVSHFQVEQNRLSLVIRAAGTPGAIAARVRQKVAALDRQLPVYSVSTMDDVVLRSPAVFARRYALLLIGAFATAAVLLAMVGVYGVVAFVVGQRQQELGIRAALGATRGRLLLLVLRHGALLAVSGIVAGTALAVGFSRLLGSLLFGIAATDPLTFGSLALVLAGVALAACLIPAWRAAATDPVAVLRLE